jgi:GAF domain-containing protein
MNARAWPGRFSVGTELIVSFELPDNATYDELLQQAEALLTVTDDAVANAANLSAFLFNVLQDVNWAGFYFLKGEQLVVGPFQGKPACVLIPVGQGVCGAAAATGETQRIEDVHAFDGHIACDAASRSEIVLPLLKDGKLLGVLDVDSPRLARFGAEEQAFLEAVAKLYLNSIA